MQTLSKVFNAITALAVLFVIPLNAILAYQDENGMFAQGYARVFNMFWFFTILSNILVGYVSYKVVVKGYDQGQRFETLKQTALVAITVTGIVYHLLLAADADLSGLNVLTDFFLHTYIPIAYVLSWLLFNVRGKVTTKVALKALIFPTIWAALVLVRGVIVDYYPYPFMDVRDLGYDQALTTMAFVTAFFFLLTFGYKFIDQVLNKFQSSSS